MSQHLELLLVLKGVVTNMTISINGSVVVGSAGPGTSGTDANRPTASSTLVGSIYRANDTDVTYVCEPGAPFRWRVNGRQIREGYDTTSVKGDSTRYGYTSYNIDSSTILTLAICFSVGTLPSGGKALLSFLIGGPDGWQVEIGEDPGNRGLLSVFRSSRYILTNADAAALNTMHCFAMTINGGDITYVLDGGTVTTVTTGVPTNPTTAMHLGSNSVDGGGGTWDSHITACKLWTGTITDSNLDALSLAGMSGRIGDDPDGATCVFDWHASRYPEFVSSQRVTRGLASDGHIIWTSAPPFKVV